MTETHICLDLETWGKRPGMDLRSIGACIFMPKARKGEAIIGGTFYQATNNPYVDWSDIWSGMPTVFHCEPGRAIPRKYGLQRDPETVAWWNDQSPEAQAAFSNPIDLRDALALFAAWLAQVCPVPSHLRLWAHGAAFDPPLLAAAYLATGLPVPWHYRAPRDTRTLFDAAGIMDHSAWLDEYKTGTFHHALDDAICEARAIAGAYGVLRL